MYFWLSSPGHCWKFTWSRPPCFSSQPNGNTFASSPLQSISISLFHISSLVSKFSDTIQREHCAGSLRGESPRFAASPRLKAELICKSHLLSYALHKPPDPSMSLLSHQSVSQALMKCSPISPLILEDWCFPRNEKQDATCIFLQFSKPEPRKLHWIAV